MAQQEKNATETLSAPGEGGGVITSPKGKKKDKPAPAKAPPAAMPLWKVLLHNDDKNEMVFVVQTIIELTHLNQHDAKERMLEAHKNGVSLLLVTSKERAELYVEQFHSKGLVVTIEPDN